MEIDRRLGGLLGPLAEGLARVVEAAEKAGDAGDAPHEATVETARGPMTVRAGYSVRMGGRTVSASSAPPAAVQATEPTYETYDGPDGWTLTAETPGAAAADLRVRREGARLVAETVGARRWRLEVTPPGWAAGLEADARLMNGVLDIAIRRPEGARP